MLWDLGGGWPLARLAGPPGESSPTTVVVPARTGPPGRSGRYAGSHPVDPFGGRSRGERPPARLRLRAVPVRMGRVPAVRRLDDLLDPVLGCPAEQLPRLGVVPEHLDGITRPAGHVHGRDVGPADPAGRLEHLTDRRALAGPEVDGRRRPGPLEVLERPDVGVGQVLDVDVVTDGRPVWGGVV